MVRKIYSMLLIRLKKSSVPECHSYFESNTNSLIIYQKNFIRFGLAENERIFFVTRVQITNSARTVKISSLLTVCGALFILTPHK